MDGKWLLAMPVSLIKYVLYLFSSCKSDTRVTQKKRNPILIILNTRVPFFLGHPVYAGVIFADQNRILVSMKIKCLVLTCYLYAATIHMVVLKKK